MFSCPCGFKRETPLYPIYCKCGKVYKDPNAKPTGGICTHRGPRIGNASCGCGAVYECGLHGVLCGNKQPPDEWADVNGRLLGPGFRVCGKCGDNSVKPDIESQR
jgi:hypothetical protein